MIGSTTLSPLIAEDRARPRRRERLNADPKVLAFGAVDGEGLCTSAECATRKAVLRASAHLRVKKNTLRDDPCAGFQGVRLLEKRLLPAAFFNDSDPLIGSTTLTP